MLNSVKHSPGSYESASETSDQTVAQCQDKLQKLLSIMTYVFLRGFWTNFNSTVLPKNFS